ncbi:hypothetical protein [Paenibacillus sp. 481]|uniref:hypothetical protein n=1 Tax=Paenibacillus sp. 481 TaxID=2835869 RepID=UPI001E391A14|nr:hypothetical protein [Paenibacillus sp. 481]UHA74596.1 hypothetical protein KIK04_05760 [Paenibacillus sp. 481]
MRNNKSKWMILFGAVMSIALLAGCGDKEAATAKPEVKTETNNTTNNNKQETQTPNANVFTSKEGQFTLAMPEKWANTVKMEERKDMQELPGVDLIVEFNFTPDGKKDSESLFTIHKMSKKNFEAMSKEEGPGLGEKIAENDEFVWVGTTPQSNPFEPESKEGKQFNSLMMEFDYFKTNLKIVK